MAPGTVTPAGDEPYPTYFHLLVDVHRRLRPRTYLEVGVNEGHSLALAGPATRIVGVDPEPKGDGLDHPDWTVVPETSEVFFGRSDVPELLGAPLDLAFVDGLHLFEVALADVLAVERLAHPGTVVLVHDVLPIDAETSSRERSTAVWSGDVWKTVVLLRRHRPDLAVTTLDVGPTGMAVITGFGSGTADPLGPDEAWVDTAVAELLSADHGDLLSMGLEDALGVVPGTPTELSRLLPGGAAKGPA